MTQSDSYHPPRVDSDFDTAGSGTEAASETALPALSSGQLRYHLLPREMTISIAAADLTQYRDHLFDEWDREHRAAQRALRERTGTKEERAQRLQAARDRLEDITDLNDRGLDVPRKIVFDDIARVVESVGVVSSRVFAASADSQSQPSTAKRLTQFSHELKRAIKEGSTLDEEQYIFHETPDTFAKATSEGQTITSRYGIRDNEWVVDVQDFGERPYEVSGSTLNTVSAKVRILKKPRGDLTAGQAPISQSCDQELIDTFKKLHARLRPMEGQAFSQSTSGMREVLGYQQNEVAMSAGQLVNVQAARKINKEAANEARAKVVSLEIENIIGSSRRASSDITVTVLPAGKKVSDDLAAQSILAAPTED